MDTVTINIDKRPFIVGDKRIAQITVRPIRFAGMVKAIQDAADAGMDKDNQTSYVRRARISTQADFIDTSGEKVIVDHLALSQMPREYASKLIKALDENGGKEGSLVNDGDGVSGSLIYKLGTPIAVLGGENNSDITELEFAADTFGEVEDVLAETNSIEQTLALLKKIAKPAGNTTLIALPSWAVDAIAVQDGFTIMEKVLPRFLE